MTPARAQVCYYATKHALVFTMNPGGGEFNHPTHGRCQVHMEDDQDDLDKLMAWLREKGLEAPSGV